MGDENDKAPQLDIQGKSTLEILAQIDLFSGLPQFRNFRAMVGERNGSAGWDRQRRPWSASTSRFLCRLELRLRRRIVTPARSSSAPSVSRSTSSTRGGLRQTAEAVVGKVMLI